MKISKLLETSRKFAKNMPKLDIFAAYFAAQA
jgi:hypothetical protein